MNNDDEDEIQNKELRSANKNNIYICLVYTLIKED